MSQEFFNLALVAGVFLFAALLEYVREKKPAHRCSRTFAVTISLVGLAIAIMQSLGVRIEAGELAMGGGVMSQGSMYVHKLTFEGKYLCSIISAVLFLGGVLFAPAVPLVRVRMSRVFLMQGLLLALIEVQKITSFLLLGALLILLCINATRHHARSLNDDNRGEMRARTFARYQWLALIAILASLGLRALEHFSLLQTTETLQHTDLVLLCLASSVVLGLFPFHGWVITFLGTPRSTIFLPMCCIQTGMLFFFRLYAPIVTQHFSESTLLLILPVTGLVYAAILFFGERRLKRIPGYLYLSHVSLMALSADDFGALGITTSLLNGVNLLIATLGLLGVCALLTARFGVRGVLTPSGLGSRFPELAVCYLVCVLSLVGFPGTLGFIQEEIMLGEGLEHHALLIGVIALALTLNGFSGFRLFARIFYGQPFEGRDTEIGLSLRERGVLFLILALIVINGLAPSFLISTLTRFGHSMPGM